MMVWSMPCAVPNVHQTLLEFVNVVQPWLIHSLLDDAPYLVVNWIEVRTVSVWRPQIRWNKAGVASSRSQCHVPGVQEHCPVERWRTRLTRQHHWQQLLWQEHVTAVGAVHLCSWIDEDKVCVTPSFDTQTETMTDWLNIVRVRSRRSAATCFYFTR